MAPKKTKNKIYEIQGNLEVTIRAEQIRVVWKIKVNPRAKGCVRKVNIIAVNKSRIVAKTIQAISENSLIKILVLETRDRR